MDKKTLAAMKKKTGDELQQFFAFKKRGGVVPAKKGKGSYKRQRNKDYMINEWGDIYEA